MKKNIFILVLVTIIIILLSFIFLEIKTEQNNINHNNNYSRVTSDSIRLSTNIQDNTLIDILNKYAKSDDIIEIRAREIEKLDLIKKGAPMLIYGKNDNQTESFNLAKKYGVEIIGYNLEDSKITKDELIEKEKENYTLAKNEGFFYAFAPLAIHAEKYGADLAKNADAVVIQLRNYQLMDNFADKVKDMTDNIKNSNPDVEVWVQLDVNPRIPGNNKERQSLNIQELLNQIELIQNYVDLISLYYPPNDSTVIIEVFRQLRQ